MSKVVAVDSPKGYKNKVKVHLEDGHVLSVSREIASEANLHQGQILSSKDIEHLKSADDFRGERKLRYQDASGDG